jgi:hypothetical protein
MDNDNLPLPPFMDPSDNLIPPFMDPNANFLIFPDNLDTLSDITTILFISEEITDYKLFYDSVNSTTFPIVYSAFRSSKASINEVLTKFTSIQRIGFAFHSSSGNEKKFLDGTPLFTDPDISNENVYWLLQVIKDYNVKNVDFLACDSLLYENWVKYFDLLHKETGVIVGASNDKTGNIKYGGDWVLESTGEDVELIYFTTSIEYYKNLLYAVTINNITYDLNDITLEASVTGVANSILGNLVITATISYNSKTYNVTSIGNYAFFRSNFTGITIPNSVVSIGDYAFHYAFGISNVTIPNGVVSIGEYAFWLSNLRSVTISSSVKSIGSYAFFYCQALRTVTFQDGLILSQLGYGMFAYCISLTNITLPNVQDSPPYKNSKINSGGMFSNCSGLKSFTIPNSWCSFGSSIFSGCSSLTNITIPDNITYIGQSAFNNCTGLTNISLPNTMDDGFGNNCFCNGNTFYNCISLKSIKLPSAGIKSIQIGCFYNCTSLTNIIIPNSLTYIGERAFSNCSNLITVTFGSGVTQIENDAFQNTNNPLIKLSFKSTITLPIIPNASGSVIPVANTAYYNAGVLPPSGQGTDPAAYLRNTFNSTIAQIIDPPQLPITATTTWHLLSSVTVNGITFTPAYANTGLVYLPYRRESLNPTVTAINSDPFSIITNISGITNLTPNAYNNIQITVTSNEYNTYTWSVPVFVSGPSCFLEGSRILCLLDNQEKYVPVEKIRKGTLVKTLSSGYKPVDMIGHAKVYNSGDSARIKNRLFRCSKKNYPELFEDLIITGCHSILVGDITAEQRAKSIEYNNDIYITENRYRLIACLDDRAEPYEVEGEHPIWHLALENNDIYMNYGIFANGLLVETASKRMMKEYSGMELLES